MPELALEVGEPPVHCVELVGHALQERAHFTLVEALARLPEVLPFDVGGCEPGLVRAGPARLFDRHRAQLYWG
jgi:hypothetical protein